MIVTEPVPEVPDHGGKRARTVKKPGCNHYVPAGTKCKICGGAQ
jgi:hypothetical protein